MMRPLERAKRYNSAIVYRLIARSLNRVGQPLFSRKGRWLRPVLIELSVLEMYRGMPHVPVTHRLAASPVR